MSKLEQELNRRGFDARNLPSRVDLTGLYEAYVDACAKHRVKPNMDNFANYLLLNFPVQDAPTRPANQDY